MIKGFEKGKYYRCLLTERPEGWNSKGKMDAVLDGKPHKCTEGHFRQAAFDATGKDQMWFWQKKQFEEVQAEKRETFKKGDMVYSIRYGKGTVSYANPEGKYPVGVDFEDPRRVLYTKDGKIHEYESRDLFFKEPVLPEDAYYTLDVEEDQIFTMEQIAKALNVSVANLRIKE